MARNETLAAFDTTIMKILEYPLLTTTFTNEEYQEIVRLVQETALLRSRICRRLLLKLRYRIRDCARLGMKNLFILQGVEKLDSFISDYSRQ